MFESELIEMIEFPEQFYSISLTLLIMYISKRI